MKILITAPSLDTNKNVSGISSIVANILNTTKLKYKHFEVGKQDKGKRNINWILTQLLLPIKLFFTFMIYKIDVFHLNAPLNKLSIPRDFTLLLISKLFNKKVLLHLHGGDYLHNPPKSKLMLQLIKFYLENADIIITLSEYERKLISINYNIDIEKIDFLENCVVPIKKIEKTKRKKVRIIFLGRIVETKGIKEIIIAMKRLYSKRQDFEFYLYGTGSSQEYMIKELTILNKSFKYMGVVSGESKDKAMQESDIFILPSYAEGLPMALLEAMNTENIVIVTKVGTMGTIIKDSLNGFIIEKKNAEDLFNKMDYAINLINQGDNSIQKATKNLILEKYNSYTYIDKLNLMYKKILDD